MHKQTYDDFRINFVYDTNNIHDALYIYLDLHTTSPIKTYANYTKHWYWNPMIYMENKEIIKSEVGEYTRYLQKSLFHQSTI